MSTVNKLRLDLPLVLPNVEAGDQCVTRLIDAISGRTGIDQAHVVVADDSEPQLCVHYQPELISLGRVRELIQSAGAQITARYAHLVFRDNAALHARSARRIADGLRKVPGVLEAELAVSGALRVEYDRSAITDQALLQAATALGLEGPPAIPVARQREVAREPTRGKAQPGREHDQHHDHDHGHDHGSKHSAPKPAKAQGDHAGHSHGGSNHDKDHGDHAGHDHAHGGIFGEKSELIFALLAGALVLVGWLVGKVVRHPIGCPPRSMLLPTFSVATSRSRKPSRTSGRAGSRSTL
jgi:Cd2+/Zn2+-exporting ATPase